MRFKTYRDSLNYLFESLPMFSRIGQEAFKPSLDNITALCSHIGNPQNKFKTIHVAGSNGKGSTSHILAGTLQDCGYKVGLYTSPHLTDIRERFRINGQLISEQFILDFLNQHIDYIEQIKPSYFELNVAMAFEAFAQQKVDIAVIETGLGGRLDSTNIIVPVLSVITNISLEHTDILGNTLALIAKEKAGIIKPGVPVIIGETHTDTEQVFFLAAHQNNSPILFADARWDIVKTKEDQDFQYLKLIDKGTLEIYDIKTDLKGSYQPKNIITCAAAISVLQGNMPDLSISNLISALAHIKTATGLRGRWEKIQDHPTVIIDVAHNPAGMEYFLKNISSHNTATRLHIVLGFANDKDVEKVLPYFPKLATYYLTQANVPRAMAVETLAAKTKGLLQGASYSSVAAAVESSLEKASENDIIIITGSFFVVADALNYFNTNTK